MPTRTPCQDPDFSAELVIDGDDATVILQSIIEAKILWERKRLFCHGDVWFVPTERPRRSRAGWVCVGVLRSRYRTIKHFAANITG
jgi:hypothetical protein